MGDQNALIAEYDWTYQRSISTLPYEFKFGYAVVYNNEIHILGGYSPSNEKKHYKWNGTNWESSVNLPFKVYSGVVVYNNEIHALGLYTGNYTYKHYKFNGTSWEEVSTLPFIGAEGCSVIVYNNEIYVIGGSSSVCYKWDGTNWISCGNLTFTHNHGSAVVYNNEIHILGSSLDNGNQGSTIHYKFNGTSWEEVSTLPYPFYYGSAVVLNGEIHILGGRKGNTDTSDINPYVNHYKWSGESWENVSTLPYTFLQGSAIVYNNEIHILGGADENNTKHYQIGKLIKMYLNYLDQHGITKFAENINNKFATKVEIPSLENYIQKNNITGADNYILIQEDETNDNIEIGLTQRVITSLGKADTALQSTDLVFATDDDIDALFA